jgi:hypothetical protein
MQKTVFYRQDRLSTVFSPFYLILLGGKTIAAKRKIPSCANANFI